MDQHISTSGAVSPLKKLLTESDLSELLSVSPRHIVALRQRGLLSYVRLGRLVRFDPERVARELGQLTVEARS